MEGGIQRGQLGQTCADEGVEQEAGAIGEAHWAPGSRRDSEAGF